MKKSIIAIAVAGVLAAPLAAQAETSVFGIVHMSAGTIEETQTSGGATTTLQDNMTVDSHASRLGVKGSHDLGGGMSAKYHIEYGVNPEDSTDAGLSRRNQWAGIAAGWGEVRIGRHDTPLKMAQGKFDQFNDTAADIKGAGDISQGENRVDNAIAYIGKFGGITVAAATVASEGDGSDADNSGDTLADTTSVAAMYKAGPLFASLAMDSYDAASANTTDSLLRAVATYKMGSMQAGFMYETGGNGGDAEDKDIIGLSFAMGMGKNKLKLQYVTSENASTTAFEQTQATVGYDVGLSKQVTAYAMYTAYEGTVGSIYTEEYTATRLGLKVKF